MDNEIQNTAKCVRSPRNLLINLRHPAAGLPSGKRHGRKGGSARRKARISGCLGSCWDFMMERDWNSWPINHGLGHPQDDWGCSGWLFQGHLAHAIRYPGQSCLTVRFQRRNSNKKGNGMLRGTWRETNESSRDKWGPAGLQAVLPDTSHSSSSQGSFPTAG